MKQKYIKSPLNYTGSKYRLIKKGMCDYFPKNVNIFVDLFCGACNVGFNVKANNIICNDYINYIPELFNCWKNKSLEEINLHIDKRIREWNLSPLNKTSFENFRTYYNQTKNIEDLFILICYSFNFQMRFNNNKQYNSSFGKESSTMNNNIRKNVNNVVNLIHKNNIQFTNKDFRELKTDKLTSSDFVYCDPPYLISNAVYQDGKRGFKGWSQQDDNDLMMLLDKLNNSGIRFALSNVLESKGNKNNKLIEWSNKYNIFYMNHLYSNANYQRQYKGKDIEVLITNY